MLSKVTLFICLKNKQKQTVFITHIYNISIKIVSNMMSNEKGVVIEIRYKEKWLHIHIKNLKEDFCYKEYVFYRSNLSNWGKF